MAETRARTPGYQRFFAELKRRHVFRVAAVYGATGFVVLQAADLLAAGMGLPDLVLRTATFLVLLGFPFALVLAWAYERTPDGVRRTDAAASGELEAIVAQPAARRWPSGLLALAGVAMLVAGAWWVGRSTAPGARDTGDVPGRVADGARSGRDEVLKVAYADLSTDDRPSVAVLPFVNMSADAEQEYFADGMTEEVLNALAKIRALRVAGRTSSFAYKGEDRDLREIGAELGVRYLVEGSVRKHEDRLRITAQLVDAADAFHLWSETYDRTLDDVFAIQEEIAEAIAEALEVSLGLTDDGALVTPTADLDAYDLYLAAQARFRERRGGVAESIRLFEATVARDSSWAPAWAGLALASSTLPYWEDQEAQLSPDTWSEAFDMAERAARRALALDPDNAAAEVALGNVYRDRREWAEAEPHYLRALAIDPDDVEAHQQYSELLLATGRLDESLRSGRRAVELDPTAAIRRVNLAYTYLVVNRGKDAEREYRRARELDPAMWRARWGLLLILERNGEFAAARSLVLGEMIPGGLAAGAITEADTARIRGNVEARHAALRAGDTHALAALAASNSGPTMDPGLFARLGDTERALDALAAEVEADPGYGTTFDFVWAPEWDAVRSDPRFRAVLRHFHVEGVEPRRPPPGA